MAIPQRTDWSKMRYSMFVLYCTSALLASTIATDLATSGKHKRQLYREHLLPQQGGKIPETAFDRQRLILNKFGQNGIYTTDGFYIQQRHPNRSPLTVFPDTIKITLPPNNVDVAPPGRSYSPQVIDTTYLIRSPVNYVLYPSFTQYQQLPRVPQNSLMQLRRFKYAKNHYLGNDIFQSNESKILQELAPYLRKLHETD